MKITEILKNNESGVSFEFFPPRSEKAKEAFLSNLKVLKEYNPLYVSMTYGASGGDQQRTKEAVEVLLKEKSFEVMPHLTCVGADKQTIDDLIKYYQARQIENILALRGDLPQDPDAGFCKELPYGRDLVSFIRERSEFCIGVAVYPEGHSEAGSLEKDTVYTKAKVDSGADFAVTQMFFDNDYYFSMLERLKKAEINIPVLPGILPLTNLTRLREFSAICGTKIPKRIEEALARFEGKPKDMEKAGIELTIAQCQELKSKGVKYLHFFTLNRSGVIRPILESLK